MAGTNTFTQAVNALRSTAGNWSLGHVPVDGTENIVMGADSTGNTGPVNLSGASMDFGGFQYAGVANESITATGSIGASSGSLNVSGASAANRLSIIGTLAGVDNGDMLSNIAITGNYSEASGATSLDHVSVSGNVDMLSGGSTAMGTNFTVGGTTLMNGTGSLTGVFAGLVTTASTTVNNVTGTLTGGLAYTTDGGATKFYGLSAIPQNVRPGPNGSLVAPLRSRGRMG